MAKTTQDNADRSMTAIVEFQIRSENASMDQWLAEWSKRAQDALEGEPETSAYEAAINLEDESNVLVFERYRHGQKSLQLHMQRPAHTALTEVMGERRMTKRRVMGTMFTDLPDYGWWSRPERAATLTDPGALLVILGMRFPDERARDAFVKLSAGHAAYCWDAEPETLIYSGGLAVADADRGIDIKQGDLIFVMGCTDMAAVEKHRDDPHHLALGEKFAQQGITLESTFSKTYRTTGKGFLWNQA